MIRASQVFVIPEPHTRADPDFQNYDDDPIAELI